MFDVLAHPDLVKVWGSRVPEGDLRRFYDRAMDGIAESDVAIEVSTAGLRKPVGEIYPARAFLEMCLEAGRPVALSSDAHLPEQVGYEYERAVEWLSADRGRRAGRLRAPRAPARGDRVSDRSGIGFDSHRLEAGRPLVLGGVEIEDAEKGLAGHSDADVLTHAIIDALLGAAGLGDIGQHFPDTDDAWKGANSMGLLSDVCTFLEDHGWTVRHVDCTLICEAPKMAPHRDDIRRSLARCIGLKPIDVNVKFTTNEGMGFVGRGEGMAALAVASVERAD